MANEGWVKVHRKIINSSIFNNPQILRVWIWCLCKAAYEEQDVLVGNQIIVLKPGQFIFGRRAAAVELNINERTLYDYMQTLKKLRMIVLDTNNKFTLVTIVNWAFYQDESDTFQQQTAQQTSQQITQQTNTYKNNKEIKNKRNNINTVCKADANALFERLWALYPSKRGKGQVKDTQKARLLEIGEEELKRAIERYKADLKKDEWRKPQNGSTFFNSGYLDYIDNNYKEQESSVYESDTSFCPWK